MAKHIHIYFAPRRAVVADAVRRFLDQAPGSVPQGDDMTALVDALHAAIAAREGAAPTQDADWDESAHPRGEGGKWTSGQHQVAAQRHEQLAGMHKASPVGQAHAKAAEAHQLAAHHLNTQTGWAEHHAAKAHQLSAAANQATSMTQTPEQLKAVAQDPQASVEERAAAVQQLDKMEKAANAVASSPHAVPKPAAPAMAHGANDPYRQSGGGEQMAHGGPQGAKPDHGPSHPDLEANQKAAAANFNNKNPAGIFTSKPTKAVNTASTKAATHELLSTGHPFSIDELMAATGAKSKVTLMTALSDLKNPKYAGKLGNLEIVKRPDGMYHVAKAPAGGFTAPKPADTNAAPAAPQQPGAEASADPTAVASGSHPLSDYMPGQMLTAKGASGKQYKVLGHNAAGNVVIQSPTGTKHHMEPAALKNATVAPATAPKPDPVTGMPPGMVSPADRAKIQAAQAKQASLTPKQAEKQDVEAVLARPLDKPSAKPTVSGSSTGQRNPGEKFAGAMAANKGGSGSMESRRKALSPADVPPKEQPLHPAMQAAANAAARQPDAPARHPNSMMPPASNKPPAVKQPELKPARAPHPNLAAPGAAHRGDPNTRTPPSAGTQRPAGELLHPGTKALMSPNQKAMAGVPKPMPGSKLKKMSDFNKVLHGAMPQKEFNAKHVPPRTGNAPGTGGPGGLYKNMVAGVGAPKPAGGMTSRQGLLAASEAATKVGNSRAAAKFKALADAAEADSRDPRYGPTPEMQAGASARVKADADHKEQVNAAKTAPAPIPRWPRSERTATTKPAPAFSLGWVGGAPGAKEEPSLDTLHAGITKAKLAQKGVDVKHIGTQPLPQQRQMLLDLARQHGVKPQYTVPADPNVKPDLGDGLTPQQRSAKRSDAYLKQRWIKK